MEHDYSLIGEARKSYLQGEGWHLILRHKEVTTDLNLDKYIGGDRDGKLRASGVQKVFRFNRSHRSKLGETCVTCKILTELEFCVFVIINLSCHKEFSVVGFVKIINHEDSYLI